MTKLESLKDLIFMTLFTLLLIVVVVVFIHMIKTEHGSGKMMNFLTSIGNEFESQEKVKKELDLRLLESEQYQNLKQGPISEETFSVGKRNPFQAIRN